MGAMLGDPFSFAHSPEFDALVQLFQGRSQAEREDWRVERGEAALDLMEGHLADATWFAGGVFSLADIALHAYTGLAHEGGFDLDRRPRTRDWIARVDGELDR